MKTIAIVGAECTGKTTLSEALAERLGCPWVAEYGREWVRDAGRPVEYADVKDIFEGQQKAMLHAVQKSKALQAKYLVFDTSVLQTCVYSDFYFGKVSDDLQAASALENIALYLVTDPTIPWVEDPLQRGEERYRRVVHEKVLTALKAKHANWELLQGAAEDQLIQAWSRIKSLGHSP